MLSVPTVSTTITATSRPERINENAEAGTLDTLPQEPRDYVREETALLVIVRVDYSTYRVNYERR